MKVSGKVMVVTGGGNGIGRAVVLELLRRGAAAVAAVDIREWDLEETARLAGGDAAVSTHVVDITDRKAVEALPDEMIAQHGVIDGVINVAGIIQPFVPLAELDYSTIERVVDVNLYGTIHIVKAFLPHLLARPDAHIATVSSMGGFLPVPGQTAYGASKAAVRLLTEGLYTELLDTNVGVSVVLPGAVGTDISANSGLDMPGGADAGADAGKYKMTSAEDAARIIVDGVEKKRLHILVGRDASLMFRLNRLAPRRSTHLLQRKMRALLDR